MMKPLILGKQNMARKFFFMALAFLVLLAGALIYLCFRPPIILLFRWLDLIGFNYLIFQNFNVSPPPFFIYNLPNALFVIFGYISLYAIWGNKKRHFILYSSAITVLSIIYEIVTLDISDMVTILITFFLCLFLYLKFTEAEYET